jgi:uncharacterized protein
MFTPERDVMTPTVTRSSSRKNAFGNLMDRLEGRMTFVFIGIAVALFLVQRILNPGNVPFGLDWELFAIKATSAAPAFFLVQQPWTLVTNIFAHGSFGHLLINMLMLFLFGSQYVIRGAQGNVGLGFNGERLIGTRRFVILFFAAGIIASVAQVTGAFAFQSLARPGEAFTSAWGASGAVLGLMGILTVLMPRATVLILGIFPAKLWVVSVIFIGYDLLFNVIPGSGIGGIAHIVGFFVGFWYGKRLLAQGLRVRAEPRQGAPSRRSF